MCFKFHRTDWKSSVAIVIISFEKAADRKTCAALAAFTLIEIMVALGIFMLVTGGIIYGYLQSNRFAEWSTVSLAAQSYAAQGVEQVRAATWSASATATGLGTGNEIPTNITYYQTNAMQIPISGQIFYVTNWISVSNLQNSTTIPYSVRQIRADCVWQFPLTGTWFSNTVITERAPDQ